MTWERLVLNAFCTRHFSRPIWYLIGIKLSYKVSKPIGFFMTHGYEKLTTIIFNMYRNGINFVHFFSKSNFARVLMVAVEDIME